MRRHLSGHMHESRDKDVSRHMHLTTHNDTCTIHACALRGLPLMIVRLWRLNTYMFDTRIFETCRHVMFDMFDRRMRFASLCPLRS